jgi:hypothetical protein
MRGRAVVIVGLAMAGCLWYPGCASTVEDPATGAQAQYEWETLEAELDPGIRTAHLAAREAVDRLDLRVLRDELDGIAAEILALDAHFDSIEIRLAALPESGTLLTIRIGLFGDRNKSAVLFGRIMQSLGRRAPATDAQDLPGERPEPGESGADGQDLQRGDQPFDPCTPARVLPGEPPRRGNEERVVRLRQL